MQREFLERLEQRVRDLVVELEAKTGRDVVVQVDPARAAHRRPDGRDILACVVDAQGAVLKTPSVDYFPDGGVYHELRHIHRLLIEGVPRLVDNWVSPHWRDGIDEGLHQLDNTLEHFVIVPEEITRFPERAAHWTGSLLRSWQRDIYQIESREDQRQWALVQAVFTRLALPRAEVDILAETVLEELGLTNEFQAFLGATLEVVQQKEQLVRVAFEHMSIPRDVANFEYLDLNGTLARESPVFG